MADIGKTYGILFKAQDQASGVAEKLADEMEALDAATEAAAAASRRLGTEEAIKVEALRRTQVETARLQIETAKLTGNSELLARATKLLGTDFEFAGTQEEALLLKHGKLAAETDLAKAKTEQLAEKVKAGGDAADKASTQTDKFAAALKLIATAAVVREFIDANAQLEKLTLGFTSVAGTSAGAAKEMDFVRDASERLGIKLTDAGAAYLKVAAATKGTALEGEGARVIFEAVAKQLALLGGSSADVSGALVQVAQGISKGKFELEDLKSIAERMPGFFDKFATSLDVTTPALFKLIEQGKIGGPEFLKFAQAIKGTIDAIDVDTFEAKSARMQNAWDRLLVSIGKAGVFEAAKEGLDLTGFAIEKAGGAVEAFTGTLGAIAEAAKKGDISGLWDNISAAINKAGAAGIAYEAKLLGIDLAGAKVNETTAETARLARLAADAMAGDEAEAETARLLRQAKAQQDAITQTSAALKALGVDSKKVNADLIDAFETVASSATVTGKEISAGFGAALKSAANLDDINKLGGAITQAFVNGRLSADEFGRATVQLGEAQQKLLDPANKAAEAIKKTADETQRAKENTDKLTLELEKLASNERIKLIEAKVQLDIAQLQEDTKRVEAAFNSINEVIGSTNDLMGDLFNILAAPNLDWAQIRAIEDQIAKENDIKKGQLDLQRKLIEAQVANLNAQTAQIQKGDALIKIDGAGLQPHLEGFMWEILRTIQMRANRDGKALLLGL